MIHKLQRSGNAPLLIDGELIAEADGGKFRGKDRTRYFAIRLFQTADGYAASVTFTTSWEGEPPWAVATMTRNLAQLVEWLNTCQRQPQAIGYPVGEQFEGRQKRLLAELDAQYASMVSTVLDSDRLDWANDHPPTPESVYSAVFDLDAFLAGDLLDGNLQASLDVLQAAKASDLLAAIQQVAADNEEMEDVPDATA